VVPGVLAVVATRQEQDALLRDVTSSSVPVGPYRAARCAGGDVVVSGIGPAAAAAATATALALGSYDACLSVGICGAFRGTAGIGDAVVSTHLVAGDLGADAPAGFLGLGALGWDEEEVEVDPVLLAALLKRVAEPVTGPVLTVSTVTGTRARADELAARHGAVAEAMEGWGVWEAARRHGLPVAEVRTVSNLIGDRDPSAWDIAGAFAALGSVGARLLGEPWD
jgi:futalosine hydrolase